jgi:membrane-associated HD superfamily phosphohydrolase
MRKHWVALLSLLGLAASTVPADAQILKGDVAKLKKRDVKSTAVKPAARQTNAATNKQKLQVKQQTLRQQNQRAGAAGQTKAAVNTGTCAQKGKAALTPPPPGKAALTPPPPGKAALTPPPPGMARNKQLTKGNHAQLTKANKSQLTKANNAQLTKANNRQLTKANNAQLTKANNAQLTKANNKQLTKANNSQLTKAVPK